MRSPLIRQAWAREVRVLSVLSAGTFLFFNSYGSINVSIPMIQAEFGSSLSAVQWIATMGLVLSSSVALCLGRAGDILGRNRLYRVGVTLYGLGAALVAASQTFAQLIACRLVMTVGLAMANPMSTAITATVARPERTGWALGILLSAAGIGRATGPALGGFFIQMAGWRAVFLANAAIGMTVSVAVWLLLRDRERQSREPFDYPGAAALILGFPSVLVGLSVGANSAWRSPLIAGWFVLGGAGMAAFVLRQFRARRPLIPLPVMTNVPLVLAFLSMVLFSAAYFPIFLLSPLYMRNVLDVTPLALGLILTTLPVVAAVCSPVSGRLSDRVRPWMLVAVGLV
ncbi:MAG: MFS transporter, partial [Deltaproteobacteria bacterium]|nr:MFS transporter [Deltaproteobacteria bacterium]